jgi:hypothetical protein
VTRNHDAEGSNRLSGRRELGADLPRVLGSAQVEVQDLDAQISSSLASTWCRTTSGLFLTV